MQDERVVWIILILKHIYIFWNKNTPSFFIRFLNVKKLQNLLRKIILEVDWAIILDRSLSDKITI